MLTNKFHEILTKETKSEADREALLALLESKKNDTNESMINNQASLIESLRSRCEQYEKDRLKSSSGGVGGGNELLSTQVREYKDEINTLRLLVHRLSAELSAYQCKYPQDTPSLQASLKVVYLFIYFFE